MVDHQNIQKDLLFAIGDIHGSYAPLLSLMKKVEHEVVSREDFPRRKLIFVGDYMDRGPQSKQVISYLLDECSYKFETHFLRGNHDWVFQTFIEEKVTPAFFRRGRDWLDELGGAETMKSYGLNPPKKLTDEAILAARESLTEVMPAAHRDFLKNLKPFYDGGSHFFVHAGVRPNVPLSKQTEHDMLWIRKEFLEARESFEGKIIVHGHTWNLRPDVRPNRIGIDTRAYDTGRLTCLVLGEDSPRFIFS